MTLDEMTSALQSMFDSSSSTAQSYVQEAYRRAVADSKWLTSSVTIGTTAAGDATYPLPANLVQLDSLFVAGVEYGRVGEFDISDLNSANAFLARSGGVYGYTADSTGADQVQLFPTPAASGLTITGKGILVPADLVTGSGAGSSPVFPLDLHSVVLDGAITIAYQRQDERPDLAAVHDARFQEGVAKLRARRISRVRGRGPFQARIAGRN